MSIMDYDTFYNEMVEKIQKRSWKVLKENSEKGIAEFNSALVQFMQKSPFGEIEIHTALGIYKKKDGDILLLNDNLEKIKVLSDETQEKKGLTDNEQLAILGALANGNLAGAREVGNQAIAAREATQNNDNKKVAIEDIDSALIQKLAKTNGLTAVDLLADNGEQGDKRCVLYNVNGVEVISKNGEPVWEFDANKHRASWNEIKAEHGVDKDRTAVADKVKTRRSEPKREAGVSR